jgi:L-lactate dehydrogenase complex protein LldG
MNVFEKKLVSFKENAEATSSTVQFVQNDSIEISAALTKQTGNLKDILVSVKNKDLISPFLKSINPIFEPSQKDIITIPVCITDSDFGIADTGSILIKSGLDYGTYFSMLTQKHIVLIKASDIHDKPRDLFDTQKIILSNEESFSIISGPSATADMGSLVRGVHGPKNLHIIVIK